MKRLHSEQFIDPTLYRENGGTEMVYTNYRDLENPNIWQTVVSQVESGQVVQLIVPSAAMNRGYLYASLSGNRQGREQILEELLGTHFLLEQPTVAIQLIDRKIRIIVLSKKFILAHAFLAKDPMICKIVEILPSFSRKYVGFNSVYTQVRDL